MLLVMDVGNSHTVLGLYEGDALIAHWRVYTSHYRTADEMRALVSSLFHLDGIPRERVDGCCISSVVPQVNHSLLRASRDAFGLEPLFVGPGIRTGLVINVENPKEVGADRIVNCVAALEEHNGPLIVVDFGTATTFDALNEQGEYQGGVIVPGIEISADALYENCAKLPRVDIVKPERVIGKNTITHIRAGLTYGYADLVDGLIRRISEEMEGPSPTVVATGGLATVMSRICESVDEVDDWLTLKGLRQIYLRNERPTG